MNKRKSGAAALLICLILVTAMVLAACSDSTPTTNSTQPTSSTVAGTPTNTIAPVTTAPATSAAATTAPATTIASAPTVTPKPPVTIATVAPTQPNSTPSAANSGTSVNVEPKQYVDDRSDPIAVLRSFYNAINRKEYGRAYSYWRSSDTNQLPPYPKFEQGYADTASAQLLVGQVLGGAAAGSRYYEVAVTVKSTNTSGANQNFVGCYVLQQPNPLNFGAPPFQSMSINSASVKSVASSANFGKLMAQSCSSQSGPITITPNSGAYDSSNFLDDRSDPTAVIRSYYNAINRKEYVRAYSYWFIGSAGAASNSQNQTYSQFEQGYKNTASVQVTFGKATSDAGAGQVYYTQPVIVTARQIGDRVQTYVGCYVLHQSLIDMSPFFPIYLAKANLKEVQNINQDLTALMNQVCQAG